MSFKATRRNGESNQMQPRCDGTLLVPQEVFNDWKDVSTGGRDRVLKMWEQCSHDKVRGHWFCLLSVCSSNCFLSIQHSKLARMCFCRKCKHRVESINEQDLWTDGQFMSQADMEEAKMAEWFSSKSDHE